MASGCKREALSVTFAGLDIARRCRALPLEADAARRLRATPYARRRRATRRDSGASPRRLRARRRRSSAHAGSAERTLRQRSRGLARRLLELGLGYLALDRSTPTLSPGELQRLRLATQVRSQLFGVVYVLDEPSAGLHPADTEALLRALDGSKAAGNSLFVVEHELDVMRRADWIVDVGPGAGEHGGQVLYSGPPEGLASVEARRRARYLFADAPSPRARAAHAHRLAASSRGVTRNNLHGSTSRFPLGVLTAVTGVSGSGKSSLVSQALVELVAAHLGHDARAPTTTTDDDARARRRRCATRRPHRRGHGAASARLVRVDQKPIGRTPRSNLATYTGLFDHVRKLFAATPRRARGATTPAASRSTSPRAAARPARAKASSASSCCSCRASTRPARPATARATTPRRWRSRTAARTSPTCWHDGRRRLRVLRRRAAGAARARRAAGGRPRLPAARASRPPNSRAARRSASSSRPNCSARSAATRSMSSTSRPPGCIPPTSTGSMTQLHGLVDAGNTVDRGRARHARVAASDWVIDIGPGAGDEGGRIVAGGPARGRGSDEGQPHRAVPGDVPRLSPLPG